MWNDSPFAQLLGLRYPIVQGPFGGGLSSPLLAAAVSNAGGLGSFGAQGMSAVAIRKVGVEIRQLTAAPFAINLWISNEDAGAFEPTREAYNAALAPLLQYFKELGVEPPPFPPRPWPSFDDQMPAVLEMKPAVFSFIFGVPSPEIFEACRREGIVTVGTATTVDEAIAIEQAGADAVVASGFEAGGHRISFLKSAEASLTGTFALVPQVADAVRIPVIAAGGIADGRGIAAALTLGASAVQIGTAFLACEESNATAIHREALFSSAAGTTMLTRGYTGRLARGIRNALGETLEDRRPPILPYPLQGQLVGAFREAAIRAGRADLMSLWAGQSARLIRHRRAAELFGDLVAGTERALGGPRPQPSEL